MASISSVFGRGFDFTTPVGQMTLTVLSSVAQLETQLCAERIRVALATKKAIAERTGNGWTCGRKASITPELAEEIRRLSGQGLGVRAIERALSKKVSRTTVSRFLKSNCAT